MTTPNGTVTPHGLNDQRTIGEYVHNERRLGHADNTIRQRRSVLRTLARQLPAGLLAATDDDLAAWDSAILGLAAQSRHSYIVAVRGFYRWATDRGLIHDDPSTRLIPPRVPRRLPRPLHATETMARVDTLAGGRVRLAVLLEIGVGLRSHDVAGLDFRDRVKSPDGADLHVTGKGGNERVVPLPKWLDEEFMRYAGRPIVIPKLTGGRLTSAGVQALVRRALSRVGVEGTPHQLRHTFLTELYEETKDLRLVQDIAGHASPDTTAGYTKVSFRGRRHHIENMPKPASSSGLRVVS